MPKIYVMRENHKGAFIFIKKEDVVPKIREEMNKLSSWGGASEDTGKALGWEFPRGGDNYNKALAFLKTLGAIVVSPERHKEFWD
jgi:hypothetical protein